MGQAALPNGYGPGRRDELVDRRYDIDDGLGQDLPPAQLHRAGLTRSQLDDVAHCMFEALAEYEAFDLSAYDDVSVGDVDGGLYREWQRRVLTLGLRGWFDTLRELQPLSYAILTEPQSFVLAGYRRFFDNHPGHEKHLIRSKVALIVRDRAIKLRPYYTERPEEVGVAGFVGDALPEVLMRSWWYRTAGYQIVRSVPEPIHENAQPLLQYPGCGTGVNDLVAALGQKAKRKHMPLLKEMFGAEAVTKVYQTGRVAFLCILDTRVPETVARECGDQLFVHMARKDQTVYHVRACRFDQMKKLNPATLAECFDRYFAHVLGRVPGEFDFAPYLLPL